MANLTAEVAEYAASTSLSSLPEDVIDRAKKIIFDEIACAAFGQRSVAGALAARYAESAGSAPEAQVFGTQQRASAAFAALANGTAGHGEEVDGAHVVGGHPGASIVHATVAMAERQRATGSDLINALVLGYDLGTRIVAACGGKFVVRDRHSLTSDMFYAYGAAIGCGRILGLAPERLCHTLALVSFQSNGLYALYSEDRHISKSFCNGQYAFAGVSAPLMSAIGLEGNVDILGSTQGLLDAWGAEDGRTEITKGLGYDYAVMKANFKFLNAGYPIHTPVEAAITLVKDHAIDVSTIASIQVGMPENAMRVVDNRHMHNICVQDMLAASLSAGGLKIQDEPFPRILSEETFTTLRSKITVVVDPEINVEKPNGRGARVTIETVGGQSVSKRIDDPKGHSNRGRVTWADLEDKWLEALPRVDVKNAMTIAKSLETLEDSRGLAGLFSA